MIIWPEASQHWCLQAFGQGQVLVRKWQPSRGLVPMKTPQNYHFQCPCPCNELQPSPPPPRQTLQYWQVSLAQLIMRSLLFSWVLVRMRPCACLPIVEFLFPLVLWNSCYQTPLALKAIFSKDDSSPLPNSQAGKPDTELRTFNPIELLWYNYFSAYGSPTQHVWDLVSSGLYLPPAVLLWLLPFL